MAHATFIETGNVNNFTPAGAETALKSYNVAMLKLSSVQFHSVLALYYFIYLYIFFRIALRVFLIKAI